MISFFLTDPIASLALLVLLGGIVFFIYTLRSTFWLKPEITPPDSPQKIRPEEKEASLLEAHLESISTDLTVIKQKVDSIEERVKKQSNKPVATDTENKLEQMNHKLEAIQRILTDLSEEK